MGQVAVPDKFNLPTQSRAPVAGLSVTGLVVGIYMAIFLSQFDTCMLQLEKIRFAPVYPLLASLAAMSVATWYLVPGKIGRIIKGARSAIFSFGAIALLSLLGSSLPEANLEEGWKYILYPSVDFLVFLLALPLAVIFATATNWRFACGVALIALVISILIDARYPGTFSILETRAAGFGVNPNTGAALAALLLIGILDWKQPKLSPNSCGWFLWALIGVFMTLSRSGILVLGIVSVLYVRLCVRRNGIGTLVVLLGVGLSVGGYALMASDAAKRILPMLDGNHSRANLFSGQLDAMDTSEDSRVLLVYDYLDMIAERPILGWGTGLNSGSEMGAHNMFLARWVENGLPGLAAYCMLILMLWQIGQRSESWECMAVAAYVVAESFFSHNMLEDKSLLMVMAISAGRAILNAPQPISLANAVWGNSKIPYSRGIAIARTD